MNRFAIVVGLLSLLATTGCDANLSCPHMAIEDEAGICVCPPGTIANALRDCLAIDGGASAATVDDRGVHGDADLDARSSGDSAGWREGGDLSLAFDASNDSGDSAASWLVDLQDANVGANAALADATPACVLSTEICDAKDNDCDGAIDEDVAEAPIGVACHNDGQGACAILGTYVCVQGTIKCNAPPPTPTPEVCDGIDNDCDTQVDEGVQNACGGCGAVPAEACDGKDNNCDGQVDEGVKNTCGGCGAVPAEVCDGKDNNCDGQIDEGVKNTCGGCGALPTWFCDADGDGYVGNSPMTTTGCSAPQPTSACKAWQPRGPDVSTADCDDTKATRHPGAEPVVVAGAIVAADAPTYNGDVNCDGLEQRIGSWQYVRVSPPSAGITDGTYPICSSSPSSTFCYINDDHPGSMLDCGNTNLTLREEASTTRVVARLVCK